MATKRITVPCTPAGFNKAAEWLMAYRKSLNKKVEQLISRMVGEGKNFAVLNVSHIDTGLTIGSVTGVRNGNKGVLLVGGNAIWIEFGTGVLLNSADDVHDRGAMRINDWGTYTQDESGISQGANANGWYYYDEVRQKVGHTLGIPMNPFFHNTAKMLAENCPKYAKEIFR